MPIPFPILVTILLPTPFRRISHIAVPRRSILQNVLFPEHRRSVIEIPIFSVHYRPIRLPRVTSVTLGGWIRQTTTMKRVRRPVTDLQRRGSVTDAVPTSRPPPCGSGAFAMDGVTAAADTALLQSPPRLFSLTVGPWVVTGRGPAPLPMSKWRSGSVGVACCGLIGEL